MLTSRSLRLSRRWVIRAVYLALFGVLLLSLIVGQKPKEGDREQTIYISERPRVDIPAPNSISTGQDAKSASTNETAMPSPALESDPFKAFLKSHGNMQVSAATGQPVEKNLPAMNPFTEAIKNQKPSQQVEQNALMHDPFREAIKNQKAIETTFPFTATPKHYSTDGSR